MRIRLRTPLGASTITIADDAKISDLLSQITEQTKISKFDIKYGYPPKPLVLDDHPTSTPLSELEVKLNGEQLTISPQEAAEPPKEPKKVAVGTVSGDGALKEAPTKLSKPIALKKKDISGEVPEVFMPERNASLVLRVMPDDNSCLFRAFGTAILPGDDQSMPELRSLVASAIQSDPETYTEVVLEQKPDDYCRWIQTPDAWGGALEMGILAKHFDVEICSIDVKSLRIDTFSPSDSSDSPDSALPTTRCILVYSGIHYDTIVSSPSSSTTSTLFPTTSFPQISSSPDLDTRVFPTSDKKILEYAVELCRKLQKKGYFTDTGGMPIRCNECGAVSYGEGQASGHAMQTGHFDMQELPTTG